MIFSHELREQWSSASKIFFRLIFLYCMGYIFLMFASRLFTPVLKWIGGIVGAQGRLEFFSTGSGDTTMAYMTLILLTSCTFMGSIVWSILDRKRPSYNQLFYWFIVILRMFLVFFMFTYGFVKIFKSQFPGPSLHRLLQPLGEMSPMGLAWTYMGHSAGFNLFVGALEVLGALFLIPRRTQTLGAFITMGVMTQVVMMNFFYDIPVKLFSVHLVLMAFVIFIVDWKRFSQVFLKNQTATRLNYYRVSTDAHYIKLIFWFKVIVTTGIVGLLSWQGYSRERTYGDKREKPEFYGIWEANTFIKNGKEVPPLLTDSTRWRYLIIDRKGSATIKYMTDSSIWYDFEINSTKKELFIYRSVDSSKMHSFTFNHKDSLLRLQGIFYKDTLDVHLKARDLTTFELTNRGFHWVNETPYNR